MNLEKVKYGILKGCLLSHIFLVYFQRTSNIMINTQLVQPAKLFVCLITFKVVPGK